MATEEGSVWRHVHLRIGSLLFVCLCISAHIHPFSLVILFTFSGLDECLMKDFNVNWMLVCITEYLHAM